MTASHPNWTVCKLQVEADFIWVVSNCSYLKNSRKTSAPARRELVFMIRPKCSGNELQMVLQAQRPCKASAKLNDSPAERPLQHSWRRVRQTGKFSLSW